MDPEHLEQGLTGPRKWWAQLRDYAQEVHDNSGLLRHLVHEPLFLGAMLLAATLGLGSVLLIPKRWNPTPEGFSRVIRISLLDYLQAWSLRRSGAAAIEAGRWDDALASYRGAIGNNLVDAAALRGALGVLRDAPWCRSANLGLLFTCSELLLEVARTNRTDVLLVADVLERHRIAEATLEKLRPFASQLTPEEDRVWTRALLGSGRIEAFLEHWNANPDRYQGDPVLPFYRAAVDAGWGPPELAVPGLETLRRGLENPRTRATAARLYAAAALQRADLNAYSEALRTLHETDSAMALDDAAGWELLARAGRLEEARELARKYGRVPPPTAIEMVQLARSWLALGLEDLALDTLRSHADRYGQSVEVWTTYLDILILRKDWSELRRISATLRSNATARDALLPVTLYADLRADLAEGRRSTVRETTRRLLEAPLPAPGLALRFAAGLNAAGESETAWNFLRRIEEPFANSPDYWLETVVSARNRRDITALQKAADRLATVAPNNLVAQSIRLVTMLGTRQEPGDALALSFRLTNAGATNASARINHAMALLLNSRADEALSLLSSVREAQLTEDETNSWLIAQTDALAQLGRHREALTFGQRAKTSILLPPQETWFKQLLAECRTRSAPTNASP